MADGNRHPEIRLGAPILEDFAYIARHMRSDEVQQYLALTGLPEYVPDVAARALAATPGPQFVLVGPDGLPVLVGGFAPVRNGVYEGWLAGTQEGWDKHWRAMTKVARGLMLDIINNGRAHRVETCALVSRVAAHAWYERGLKMRRDGLLPGYFANGEDGVMFSLTRGDA